MTDTIKEARALLAHWRGIGWSDDGSAPAYTTVAALVADLEAARAELARVTEERHEWKRAAMMHTVAKIQAWTEREKAEDELAAAQAQHEIDVDYLRQAEDDRDRLIDALAAAREAMPTADDLRVCLGYMCITSLPNPDEYRAWQRVTAWMRATAYHAAHPAASPAAQTPGQPANGGGVDLEHGVPPSRGDIGGPSGDEAFLAQVDAIIAEPEMAALLAMDRAAPTPTCVCAEIDERDRPCLVCECNAPDLPEPGECDVCSGSGFRKRRYRDRDGYDEDMVVCLDCNGTGRAGGGGHE